MDGLTARLRKIESDHVWNNESLCRCNNCGIKNQYFHDWKNNLIKMNRIGEDSDEYIEGLIKAVLCKEKIGGKTIER